jgi:enoyl-[acyl-carrier protein] reductase II
LIAAGGIADGKGMLAAFALGAEAVQLGTRFVASVESSAHEAFKHRVVTSAEGETKLLLKKLTPVRLMANAFSRAVEQAEALGADDVALKELLGRARAKKGMFEGDLEEGELEIGQIAALVRDVKPAGTIVSEIWQEFTNAGNQLCAAFSGAR